MGWLGADYTNFPADTKRCMLPLRSRQKVVQRESKLMNIMTICLQVFSDNVAHSRAPYGLGAVPDQDS